MQGSCVCLEEKISKIYGVDFIMQMAGAIQLELQNMGGYFVRYIHAWRKGCTDG